jgi:DNA-binding LacI/PurR family transcriptional regulator
VIGWEADGERGAQLARAWQRRGPLVHVRTLGPARGDGEVAAVSALGQDPEATAVLAASDELALGAMDGASRLGRRVPQDVSVVGIDDIPEARLRGLTTAFVPYVPMGELATALLLDGRSEPPPFPAPVAVRASTGPAPV